MTEIKPQTIIDEYLAYLNSTAYPCIGAKAALSRDHIKCMVADHMGCPKDDRAILKFLYDFVDNYRSSSDSYHSAAILFKGPEFHNEQLFDVLLWERLQGLADLDAPNYAYDTRVCSDPQSKRFSFSLKEEAFFIIGLHPANSRASRRFTYPALVFNPHAEFEKLRELNRYENMKKVVRRRDIAYSGSANPMLMDFGESSEVYQYSGSKYDTEWQCPLKIKHGETKHNSTP